MVRYKIYEDVGLVALAAQDPFAAAELLDAGRDAIEGHGDAVLGLPLLLDFRQTDLSALSSEDIQTLMQRRRNLSEVHKGNPLAFVVRDSYGYGMARMYSAYADYYGLREEALFRVAFRLTEALDWLRPFLHEATDAKLDSIRTELENWKPAA